LVYIDDIIVVSSSSATVTALLCDLQGDFALKDLGSLHYFLGIEVQRSSNGICITQSRYTRDLLHRAGMMSCKASTTPLSSNSKLSAHEDDPLGPDDESHYWSLVVPSNILPSHARIFCSRLIRFVNTFMPQLLSISWQSRGFFVS
jgi:hypothetical protein